MARLSLLALLALLALVGCDPTHTPSDDPTGESQPQEAHDPARIVSDEGQLLVYFSGIEVMAWDDDENDWRPGSLGCGNDWCLLRDEQEPAWLGEWLNDSVQVGAAPGMNGPTEMYYTAADWAADDGTACIGLARASGPAGRRTWEDSGAPIMCSAPEDAGRGGPFAIDAAVMDSDEEGLWMVWGSHWSGIWAAELDRSTGHVAGADGPYWSAEEVADSDNPGGIYHHLAVGPERGVEFAGGTIEAAYLHERNGSFYLFVNWYACCQGAESTYEIRVGRANHPSGPFLDRGGVPMLGGGGTRVLGSHDRFIGPGHAGIYAHGPDREAFSFHFYDAEDGGTGKLAVRDLSWDEAGWPVVGRSPFRP